jgi:hypothetical protein
MKIRHSTSLIAIAAVIGTAGVAMAQSTTANSFAASVSVLSPDQTGFLIGGRVAVNGVGTGALTLSRNVANMSLVGSASSGLGYDSNNSFGATNLVGGLSSASINSELDFSRSITTSGSMVGLGSVVATGEAIAALGSAGAASADSSTSGTRDHDTNAATVDYSGTSTAIASAQGSLNGSLSTSNSLQLLGTSGLFAGSNGLTVGEVNTADAYGASRVVGDGTSGVNLGSATLGTAIGSGTGTSNSGYGALFDVTSSLNTATGSQNQVTSIGMAVSNAGNGSISIQTSTGGFFTGGAAADGEGSRNQTGSFFSTLPLWTAPTNPPIIN